MRVCIEQRGDGESLVLIHGLATTRVIWRRVLGLLEPGRRVVTLDVPGFGESDAIGPGFELDAVARRIAGALDDAGVSGPYDLVGHSMGGAVALSVAAHDPGRVRRLVLVAPAGMRPMHGGLARASGHAAARLVPLRRQFAGLADMPWGRRLLMSPGTARPADLPPAEVRAMLAASRGAARIGAALATVAAADLRPLVRELAVPVGLIWGDADRIIPPRGVAMVRAQRPGIDVELIPGAGHIPMMECPQEFVRALEKILAALSRDGNIIAAPTP